MSIERHIGGEEDMQIINDLLYGQVKIDEPVLLELLQCAAIERLKGVHQAGASYLVSDGEEFSRYEHSVGVMLLIRQWGGSLREQIAGLLHDVSHTAFSHVVDYALDVGDEDYHEQWFERVVYRTDIPDIIDRHHLPSASLLAEKHWSLLDQPAPDLCADRIDYTLREMFARRFITRSEIEQFLANVEVYEDKIITTDVDAALWFTRIYSRLVSDVFLDPQKTFADYQLAGALRIALQENILREQNLFFLEDGEVVHMLHVANHPEIERYLAPLHPGMQVVEDEHNFTVHARTKMRLIDPLVLMQDEEIVRCSELEPAIKQIHQEIIEKTSKGLFLRLASPL
jgi:HD superfamily phosphohydrolase